MLMPLDVLNIKPKGVVHLGACTGEEADIYDKAGVYKVVWVDCNPRTMAYLHMNVDYRPGHYVLDAAVGANDGEEFLFNITNNDASSSLLPLGKHAEIYPDIKVIQQIKVRTQKTDSLLKKNSFSFIDFDFANLDLQGSELLALQGMTELLQHLKWVYTEVNMQELYKGCALLADIDAFLTIYGFKRMRLADTGLQWGDALYEKS
jgi:FkbM family methyltransferase